ncbi:ribonuclease D [Ktedonosporobacter rubrisoli]|uniref:Ribonuclease D n=1 Tax=Ktedonosporobacter rubrisoli TaxID=2509675 RepID=A0A4P6JV74_KTERU|nr:ribonuclease D [Ktedonosporobacter rubrisoli]QBD79414.1 ribonuclease D [Ktedonosporobacter rubrisoli]
MSDKVPLVGPEDLDNVQPGYLGTTPPPGIMPHKGQRIWVDHPEQLLAAVEVLKAARVVAIDAEFTQVRSHTQNKVASTVPRLALLQLAVDNYCFVVDTLRLGDLTPLLEVVGDPAIAVLLHGAGADLRVMAERGLSVAHYYDLEATCRSIFGQHESSLAAMLLRAFNIHLDKSLQRTDWTRRPLPPAMIAYAARDAEVTLALYYWLKQYYPDILHLHENTEQADKVAAWIEPFLRGTSLLSPEMAVLEAKEQGLIHNKAQIAADCRSALASLVHPMRRNRLLRLIADLSLKQLTPDIIDSLHAVTSEERAGSARTLGRLAAQSARAEISQLLQDPVYDVRKAAHTALRNLDNKDGRVHRAAPTRSPDGTRKWVIETEKQASEAEDDKGWKARLRAMMDS